MIAFWKESYDKPRQCIKRQRHHFANKYPYSQSYTLSTSQVWMWELDHRKGRALKNWCLRNVVLEKTLESPLGSKELKPVNSKGNQPQIFIRRTDTEAEAPILCHLMLRSDSLKKTLMMGKIEGKRGRGWQRMRWLGGTTNLMDMNLSKLQEIVRDRELQSMGSQKVRHNLVTEQLLLTFKDSVFSNLQTR